MDREDDESDDGTAILTSPRVGNALKEDAFVLVLSGESTGAIHNVGRELVIGRGEQANLRLLDAGISRLHSRIFHRGGMIWLEDLGSTNGTRVNGELVEEAVPLKDGDKLTVGTVHLLKFSLADDLGADFHRHLSRAATRDALTGVYNRQAFEDQLAIELAYATRHRSPVSVLFVQIDDFQGVSNRYGHLASEHLLREVAMQLRQLVRQEDVVARCDHDAFCVACKATSQPEAATLAGRIRADVNGHEFSFENRALEVSCSIAIVWGPRGEMDSAAGLLGCARDLLAGSSAEGAGRLVTAPVRDSK